MLLAFHQRRTHLRRHTLLQGKLFVDTDTNKSMYALGLSSKANSPQEAHMAHGKLFVDTHTNKSMDALSLSSKANSPQQAHTAPG